jgi:hypothetical protein
MKDLKKLGQYQLCYFTKNVYHLKESVAWAFCNFFAIKLDKNVSIGTYQYENQRHVIISQKNYLYLKLDDVQN